MKGRGVPKTTKATSRSGADLGKLTKKKKNLLEKKLQTSKVGEMWSLLIQQKEKKFGKESGVEGGLKDQMIREVHAK